MSEHKQPETAEERLRRLRQKAMRLPLTPGVYIMRDKGGNIIYVGKAKALKNRVSQYFGSQNNHAPKVRRMVENVEDFEYILCDSEFEALILECSQIKQHMPKYNILLKDDKGYNYIRISREEWPRITTVFHTEKDGAEYIGPYNSGWTVNKTVEEACKIFRLPTCGKVFPRDIGKGRPCLNHFIGLCQAPCSGKVPVTEYRESVRAAVDFIKGGASSSAAEIRKEMEAAAEALEFERAAKLRDRLRAMERISQKQKVITSTYKRQDVIAVTQNPTQACFAVFVFENGRLRDCERFLVDSFTEEGAARAEFLKRYYSMRDDIPPRIELDAPCDDADLISRWLGEKSGRAVHIVVPKAGDQLRLVEMCRANASEYLAEKSGRKGRETAALDELTRLLGLPKPPEYIEAYDISNTAGSGNVAGMVVFENGRPLKSAYRKFKIKSFIGQDDYRSMAEVLDRRLSEYEAHKEEGGGFGRLPDLILLDGGLGQMNAVRPVLEAHGLAALPLFGMVKDGKHKTRAIAAQGGDIVIKSNRSAYTLISTIQEEVHRFAIGYHRKVTGKNTLTLALEEIDGVGRTRAAALLRHFKSVKRIREAALPDLLKVKGLNRPAAEAVYRHFHPEEDGTPDTSPAQGRDETE